MLLSPRTLQTQSCDLSRWAGRYSTYVEKYRPEAHVVLPDFLQPVGRCPAHCAALRLANSLRTRNAAYETAYRAQEYSWKLSQEAAADLRNDAVHVLSVGRDVRFVAALREIVGLLRSLEAVGRRRGRHEVQVTAFAAGLQKIGVRLDHFQAQLLGLAADAARSRARKPDAAAPAPAPAPHLEGGPTPTTTAVVARPEQRRPAATRTDNLRWLPIGNELAKEVGLPTNAGRADEPHTHSRTKQAAEKLGTTFWFRKVGATDSDGWTRCRSFRLFSWFLNGEKHPGKEDFKRMRREVYEVVAQDQYLTPFSADGTDSERKSLRRSDGMMFEVTNHEPSNVTGEYDPENYHAAATDGGNSSSDEESDDLEEQPVPTQPVSTQSVPAQPVVVEAPKKLCPRCVTHIDRRRRKRKKQDDSDEEFDSDEEVAAVVAVPARKRPTCQKVAAPQTAAEFQVGDRVEARFMDGEDWLPGTIKECNGDGMYAITFYDGSEDDPVREDHIRRPIVADQ